MLTSPQIILSSFYLYFIVQVFATLTACIFLHRCFFLFVSIGFPFQDYSKYFFILCYLHPMRHSIFLIVHIIHSIHKFFIHFFYLFPTIRRSFNSIWFCNHFLKPEFTLPEYFKFFEFHFKIHLQVFIFLNSLYFHVLQYLSYF